MLFTIYSMVVLIKKDHINYLIIKLSMDTNLIKIDFFVACRDRAMDWQSFTFISYVVWKYSSKDLDVLIHLFAQKTQWK